MFPNAWSPRGKGTTGELVEMSALGTAGVEGACCKGGHSGDLLFEVGKVLVSPRMFFLGPAVVFNTSLF